MELRHEVHLAAAFEDVHAFARRLLGVAVKVRGALLELGEVFHGLQRALRAEEPLDVHAAQRRRVDAVPVLVGPDVADRVGGGVGVAVGMAVETRDTEVRLEAAAVGGGVELRLRKRRDQQPQTFQLFGVEHVFEQLVVIAQRHQLAPGHVAQVGPGGQVHRRGKGRQQMLGQVEVQIEPRQIACGLAFGLVDERLREDHPAVFVVRVRQGIKPRRPESVALDLLRGHGRQGGPGDACRKLDADAGLHRLAARHGHVLAGAIGEVITFGEQRLLAFGEPGFLRLRAFDHAGEVFFGSARERRAEQQPRDGGCDGPAPDQR